MTATAQTLADEKRSARPLPNALQLVPFQRATPFAATPPIAVKLPATYTRPFVSVAMLAMPPPTIGAVGKPAQFVPSHRARFVVMAVFAVMKEPATYNSPFSP